MQPLRGQGLSWLPVATAMYAHHQQQIKYKAVSQISNKSSLTTMKSYSSTAFMYVPRLIDSCKQIAVVDALLYVWCML